MKRFVAGSLGVMLVASGIAAGAPAAHAATTWTFASDSIALPDSFSGKTADLQIRDLILTDGSISGGNLQISSTTGAAIFCTTRSFSGNVATFSDTGYAGCTGDVRFTVDSQGRLTVSSQALGNSTFLFSGTVSSNVTGTQPTPTVVPLDTCALTLDYPNQLASVTLTKGNPDADAYSVTFPGTAFPATSFSKADLPFELEVDFTMLTMGAPLIAHIDATRGFDGKVVASCDTSQVTPLLPGAPSIDGDVIAPQGSSTATVNYGVANPVAVQGIEYQIDGRGPWLRPGGASPTNGAGGSFSVNGLNNGKHSIQLRSVGFGATPTIVEGMATSFTIGAPGKPSGNTARPSQGTATGSSTSNPVPAPPAQPVSAVAGTSNGVGTGTNGALAANTGDAGIDAPCLAQNGTLYPHLYSTVGSQLTMAPNTTGMADPTTFIVTAGALPPGMQLDRMFGVIFGVPTQAGSWVTTVQATFPDGSTKATQFTTRIDADPQTLQYAALNVGVVGSPVSVSPSTNAPVDGTTYKLVCGKLPAGLRFDSRTGRIAGVPTEKLLLPTPLRVAETSTTGKAAASFLLIVDTLDYESISYPAHPHLRVGRAARISPTVVGADKIVKFRMWKGKLPRGLRLNATTGVITGKPARTSKAHTITIVAVTENGGLVTSDPMRVFVRR